LKLKLNGFRFAIFTVIAQAKAALSMKLMSATECYNGEGFAVYFLGLCLPR
jgi:hypothetical protein